MAEPEQQTKNGEEVVRKINAGLGPREIDLSVETCGVIPVNRLAPGKCLALGESIVAEIFRETEIPGDQASLCWDAMVTKIFFAKMLQMTSVKDLGNWRNFAGKLRQCNSNIEETNKHASMPAPELAFVIAAFLIRKMDASKDLALLRKSRFIEFFGDLNCMHWLPIAMKVYTQTNGRPFLIELDERVNEPLVRHEKIKDRIFLVVKTKKPPTNVYEVKMQEVVRQMTRQDGNVSPSRSLDNLEQPRMSIEKVESNDVPLESVPPSIKEQSLDHEPQHDRELETQPDRQSDTDTLREHARQMKQLGKRLPSPDQKFVRRVRRDIRRFANLADERENEMALQHSSATSVPSSPSGFGPYTGNSSIDLFGRYKMLWKGSLRENGSIPESLRELVRHDCDPNQIFYLEETESDFLAVNTLRNDENGHARQ